MRDILDVGSYFPLVRSDVKAVNRILGDLAGQTYTDVLALDMVVHPLYRARELEADRWRCERPHGTDFQASVLPLDRLRIISVNVDLHFCI